VPRTLVIQRYASTNLPRPPLLWSKKMMDKALIVLFSYHHPIYLLMNYPIYHFHLPLSPSFQKVILKKIHNHLWAKVPNIAWGVFHQAEMYTYAWVVPHSSVVVHTFYEHHFLTYNHESLYPTFNLPYWRTFNSLRDSNVESQTKNNRRTRSRGTLLGSQHFGGVKGHAGAPR